MARKAQRLANKAVLAAAVLAAATAAASAAAQAPPPITPPLPPVLPQSPLPGVVPLPPGPPPTGPASTPPAPSSPQPPAAKPETASPQPSLSEPLTLNRAVSLALGLNPNIAAANASLLTALGQTNEYRAGLRPTLSADAGVQLYSQGINAVRDNRVVSEQTHDEPTVGAQATLPIDITGALRSASDAARFEEIAARLEVGRARNEVVAGVEAAFYRLLRARALVRVAEENVTDSSARLDDANKKFQARTVGILDVVRAQTDVAEAQQGLITARSSVALAAASLDNAIGLNVDTPVNVTDTGAVAEPPGVAPPPAPPASLTASASGTAAAVGASAPALERDLAAAADAQKNAAAAAAPPPANAPATPAEASASPEWDPQHPGPDFDALVTEALANRPEVLQTEADIEAAKKGITYARRSSLPQLAVGLRYEYAASTFGTSVVLNNGQAFAGLTIPLYDAGLAHARVQEATGREASAEVQRRRVSDAVTLQTRAAYLNVAEARDRVAVANQSLGEAREAFLLARIRYNAGVTEKAGVSPLLEVSDAQAALTLAETRQVNALYDYNAARVELDRAVGRYSYAAASR